jgi:hypothetical protein
MVSAIFRRVFAGPLPGRAGVRPPGRFFAVPVGLVEKPTPYLSYENDFAYEDQGFEADRSVDGAVRPANHFDR